MSRLIIYLLYSQIKNVLVEFKKFLGELGGWAKELIKLLDDKGVSSMSSCNCMYSLTFRLL